MSDRYVIAALGESDCGWLRRITRWSADQALAADVLHTVSAEHLLALGASGRRLSVALLDGTSSGVDRDLVGALLDAGCPAVVIADGRIDWRGLGAVGVLEPDFDGRDLTGMLSTRCVPVRSAQATVSLNRNGPEPTAGPGQLVGVTGAPGSGRTSTAIALTVGLATADSAASIALIDLSRHADLAPLHGIDDQPGLSQLIDAHRRGRPDSATVRSFLWDSGEGYDLLPGLARPRLRMAQSRWSISATLAGLTAAYDLIVADVDDDIDGELETGSPDIATLNGLARSCLTTASLVIVTGRPGRLGRRRRRAFLHEMAETLGRREAVVAVTIGDPFPDDPHRRVRDGPALVGLDRTPITALPDSGRQPCRPDPELVTAIVASVAGRLNGPTIIAPPPVRPAFEPGEIGHWPDD